MFKCLGQKAKNWALQTIAVQMFAYTHLMYKLSS